MVRFYFIASLLFCSLVDSQAAAAADWQREQIRVVGSSTVFPFVASAAEEFGNATDYATPIVESTGTGGGMKLFCEGIGKRFPDIANASRQIKQKEVELCVKHGVTDIIEISIGSDGIVLASDKDEKLLDITIKQLFLALAYKVPVDGKLELNHYKTWSELGDTLPNRKIEVYGPPPTSGTRDAFVEIVMEKGCKLFPEYKTAYPDKKKRKKSCHMLREDGAFIEAGENDNLIVQKLKTNKGSYGIFGFSFLEANAALVQGNLVGGVIPTFENIGNGSYPIARSLYVYFKAQHTPYVNSLAEFANELTAENTLGDDGYLADEGLIPLLTEKREIERSKIAAMTGE